MQEASTLIEMVQAPISHIVEDIDGIRLVHASVPIRSEILILLHSHYPTPLAVVNVVSSLKARSPVAVRNKLREMCKLKLIHGDAKTGYRLTQPGHSAAVVEIMALAA